MVAVATVIVCSCMQHATAQWGVNGIHIFNTNAGNVGIGTGAVLTPPARLTVQGSGGVPAASWVSAGAPLFVGYGETAIGNADYILNMGAAAANARPVFIGRRSRGTLGAPAVVSNNDFLMSFLSSGYDGANFQNPAGIDFYVDGVPAAGSVPARISFVTGANSATRAERMRILSGGDVVVTTGSLGVNTGNLNVVTGNVNIGTAATGAKLDVKSLTGNVANFNGGASMYMGLYENDTYRGYIGSFAGANPDVDFGTGTGNTTGKLHLAIQAVPKLTVDATGNVGIGTTAPAAKLDLNSTTSGLLAKFNGGNSMYMGLYENDLYRGYIGSFAGAASDVDFGTGGGNNSGKTHLVTKAQPRLTVDSIGQIGIGTTSPTAQLDVFNNTANRSLNIISSAANGQIANISTTVALGVANDLLQLDLPASQPAGAQFIEASSGGVKFAVNSDGSVGVGGSALTGIGLSVQLGTDAALASGGYILSGLTSGTNIIMDNNEIMARNNGATSRLYLQNSGGDLSMCVSSGAVSIGTNTIATGYKLNVNGRIIGTEVRVDALANWPDYVFSPNHKLLPLEDLEASINANKHLPGIPSAAEVKEKGILLGDMQTKTMEKVEELTLYLIQLSKENKELKARLEKLENK